MKKSLLTVGALGVVITSTPTQAATWPEWFQWAISTVVSAGVTVTTPSHCRPGLAAFYQFSTRTIGLCPEAFKRGEAFVAESLAHEAVHAAQHCIGIRTGAGRAMPIGPILAAHNGNTSLLQLSQQAIYAKGQLVSGSAKGNGLDYMQEAEAYALEEHPSEAISILRSACR